MYSEMLGLCYHCDVVVARLRSCQAVCIRVGMIVCGLNIAKPLPDIQPSRRLEIPLASNLRPFYLIFVHHSPFNVDAYVYKLVYSSESATSDGTG